MTEQNAEGMAEATPNAAEFEAFSAVFDKYADQITETAEDAVEDEAPAVIDTGKTEPARDEKGKFVAKEPAEAEAPENETTTETEQAEEHAEASEDVPAPPAHLLGPIKEAWGELPQGVRDAIVKQQQDVDRRFGEVGQQMRAYKPIAERILTAAQQHEEFKGLSPDQIAEGAIRLADVQAQLSRDPVGTILRVAEQYGATQALAQKLGGQEVQPEAQQTARLHQEIASLKRELQRAMDPNAVRDVISREFEERAIVQSVQEFASGKDLYPIVEPYLPRFIEMVKESRPDLASPQAVLDAAYEMAVYAIPAAREKAQQATAKAAAPVSDPKRTEAARKAAAVNLRGRDAAKPRAKSDKEAFDEIWAKHGLG